MLEDDPLREKPASHAGAVSANDRCRIVGGFDHDPDRRYRFQQRWNAPVVDRFADLLSLEPGILVVATHPDSHLSYLETATKNCVPVVILEKPIADRYGRARRMARIERDRPIHVVVNHERRFSRDYQLARAAVNDARFGSLVTVTARLFFGSTARHDRVFLHDGTHIVDAIHFLTDDTVRLTNRIGRFRSNRSSVFLHGTLSRRNIPTVIEVGADRRYLQFEIVLSFTDGEIRIGNGVFEWRKAQSSPFYSSYRSLIDTRRVPPEPSGYFSGMIDEAVRLYFDRNAVSRSRVADGLSAMRVIRDAGRLL